MRIGFILIGLLHLGGGVLLAAQQHAAPFIHWEPSAALNASTKSRHASEERSSALGDYRYEGLAFGGAVFGALGVWMGSQISAGCPLEPGVPCRTDKAGQAVALGLAGAALGGGLGYLIGRSSPKKPPRIETQSPAAALVSVPESVRKQTGYQHWRGAAIGLGIGGAVGALTGAIAGSVTQCDDCSRQPTAANGAVTVGLLGAGAGGVLGFVAGLASPTYAWIPSGTVEGRRERRSDPSLCSG
jgi:hypothetical protein